MHHAQIVRFVGAAAAALTLVACHRPLTDEQALRSFGRRAGSPSTAPMSALREPAPGQQPPPLPVLDEGAGLADYLRFAALNNAGLESAFQRWRAADERIPQARSLPDPEIMYEYMVRDPDSGLGADEHMVGVSQMFPWFGTLSLRGAAASREAEAAQRRFEAAVLEVALRVSSAYFELHNLRREIELTRENIELLQQFERVARARYRVATGSHPDIIRVQVELGRLEDRLRQVQDLWAPQAARLNAALNRAPDEPVPAPAILPDDRLDAPDAQVLQWAAAANPELLAMGEEIEAGRIGTDLARRAYYPDFRVSLAHTINVDPMMGEESRNNPLRAGVGFTLPIWRGRLDAAVREAVARRLAAAHSLEEERNTLAAEVREALFAHRDAQRRVELFRDTLIPKATESLQASLAGYQAGTVSFLDLLDTERTLLEFQLSFERARADRAIGLARLDRLAGRPMPRKPDRPDARENDQ